MKLKHFIYLLLFAGFLTFSKFYWAYNPKNGDELAQSQRFQILFSQVPSDEILEKIQQLQGVVYLTPFSPYPSDYFSRVFEVYTQPHFNSETFKKWKVVEKVFIPQKVFLSSVYPNKKASSSDLSDTLYPYQWALENAFDREDEKSLPFYPEETQGHVVYNDMTDLDGEYITSKPADKSSITYDIDYGPESDRVANQNSGKDIVVAVIDSGIYWDHPDLKGKIYRKTEQCDERGNIPRLGRDEEGYVSDCMGWNFTVHPKHPARNRPKDILGHGTHVSGILAAVRNNNLGVAGLGKRIKIMPIKVIGSGPDEEPEKGDEALVKTYTFTDQLTKAIRYASQEGAEVINMSLGWPRIANVELVQKAIEEALAKNITIVAAAGNNSHTTRIFPCAYENVICVGAINNNGTVANYSNYGAHVDVLAPGTEILSTYPLADHESANVFTQPGYETTSGTSQAAPFASGLAALLKLKFPGLSSKAVRARMMATARPVYVKEKGQLVSNSHALAGTIQFDKALNAPAKPVLRPQLKGLDLIKYHTDDLSGQFTLNISNDWKKASNVKVEIKSLHSGVHLKKTQFHFSSINSHEAIELPIQLNIDSEFIDSEWKFLLSLSVDGKPHRKVINHSHITRDIEHDRHTTKVSFINREKSQPLEFYPVINIREESAHPSFYTFRADEGGKRTLQVFRVEEGNVLKTSPPLDISNSELIPKSLEGSAFQVLSADFNYDKVKDLMLAMIYVKDNEGFIQFSYYDQNFNPLFPSHPHWTLPLAHAVPNLKDMKLLPYSLNGVGRIAVPVFKSVGTNPELDRSELFYKPKKDDLQVNKYPKLPNPFSDALDFEDPNLQLVSIYFLEPYKHQGQVFYRPRLIDTLKFQNYIKKQPQVDIRRVDSLELVDLLPQTAGQAQEGQLKVLYSYDLAIKHQYLLATIDTQTLINNQPLRIETFKLNRRYLNSNIVKPVTELKNSKPVYNSSFSAFKSYEDLKFRSLFFNANGKSIANEIKFTKNPEKEILVKNLASFSRGQEHFAFAETGFSTLAVYNGPGVKNKAFKRQIIRSTFLPGYFYSELFFPTTIKTAQGWDPGLYVDATFITSSHVMVWHVGRGGAKVPARFNIHIPNYCNPIDQVRWGASGLRAITLVCVQENGSYFQLIPLSVTKD